MSSETALVGMQEYRFTKAYDIWDVMSIVSRCVHHVLDLTSAMLRNDYDMLECISAVLHCMSGGLEIARNVLLNVCERLDFVQVTSRPVYYQSEFRWKFMKLV